MISVQFVDEHGNTLTKKEALDKMRQAKYYPYDEKRITNLLTKPNERAKYKFGDIIQFSDANRDTESYIVGRKDQLVLSCSGYMTIPLKITKRFFNAIKHYHDYITVETCSVALELRSDDEWIIETFKRVFPKEWKIVVWYNDGEFSYMSIDFGNGKSQDFDEIPTFDEIVQTLSFQN
uniref:Uncharacterized protein n=1 Tax=Marseillevirus LCMAC102 TaxID=2506603 RepID=A0A481YTQ4_9VIRU|nr:MAG: hypothetical protein LCMAC102_00760 [Marseillevirus LCMAC102]